MLKELSDKFRYFRGHRITFFSPPLKYKKQQENNITTWCNQNQNLS